MAKFSRHYSFDPGWSGPLSIGFPNCFLDEDGNSRSQFKAYTNLKQRTSLRQGGGGAVWVWSAEHTTFQL